MQRATRVSKSSCGMKCSWRMISIKCYIKPKLLLDRGSTHHWNNSSTSSSTQSIKNIKMTRISWTLLPLKKKVWNLKITSLPIPECKEKTRRRAKVLSIRFKISSYKRRRSNKVSIPPHHWGRKLNQQTAALLSNLEVSKI